MGRLIDADALMLRLERKKSQVAKERFVDGFNDAIMKVRSMVHSAPTIDAEPVVHGRWTPIAETHWRWLHDGAHPVTRIKYKHDECGKILTRKENYCPNCGAKMDQEE